MLIELEDEEIEILVQLIEYEILDPQRSGIGYRRFITQLLEKLQESQPSDDEDSFEFDF